MADEALIAWLRRKTRKAAALRGSGLVERAAKELHWDRTEVLRGFRELRQAGVLQCADWSRDEPLSRVTVVLPETSSPARAAWQSALRQAGLEAPDRAALAELWESLEDLPPGPMTDLIDGLLRLRREQQQLDGRPRFEVSARCLLGSSKALDALPNAVLRRFGIDPARFPAFPGYVMVAGPPHPQAVLLVENPHAFERALTAPGSEQAAWVCTFGYGLSLRQGQHGDQLAGLLESPAAPRTLVRRGRSPPWEALLAHPRIRFWGDLDREGLVIFQRLRRRHPHIALSGIYHPMLERLRDGGGHPYCALAGKAGQGDVPLDPHTALLIEACRERALDQEWVSEADIGRWWPRRFEAAGPGDASVSGG